MSGRGNGHQAWALLALESWARNESSSASWLLSVGADAGGAHGVA